MRALTTIALGISEILLDRSILRLRLTAEAMVVRLGLILVCAVAAVGAGSFFLAVLYDLSAAAWGPIAAKIVLGSFLACVALALSLGLTQSRTRRRVRRL